MLWMGPTGFSWQHRVGLSGCKMRMAGEKGAATCPDREGPGAEEVNDTSQGGTKNHHFLKCSLQYHRGVQEGQTPRFWGLLLCLPPVFLGIIYIVIITFFCQTQGQAVASQQPNWLEMKSGWKDSG